MKSALFSILLAVSLGFLQPAGAESLDPNHAFQEFVTEDGVRLRIDFDIVRNGMDNIDYTEAHNVRLTFSGKGIKYNDKVRIQLENRYETRKGVRVETYSPEFKYLNSVVPLNNVVVMSGSEHFRSDRSRRFEARQKLQIWINDKLLRDSVPHEGQEYINGSMHEAARVQGRIRH